MTNGVERSTVAEAVSIRRVSLRKKVGAVLLSIGLVGSGAGELINYANSKNQQLTALEKQFTANKAAQSAQQNEINHMGSIIADLGGTNLPSDLAEGVITAAGLRSVSSLPAYGDKVPANLRANLEAATVKVASRPKGSTAAWQETCTGVKADLAGQDYVLTAGHCFSGQNGMPTKGGGEMAFEQAVNITNHLTDEFSIINAQADPKQRDSLIPMANVTGVAADLTTFNDMALLAVAPDANSSYGSFASLPSLDLNRLIDNSEMPPTAGQSVALYGAPSINGDRPIEGTGIYVGEVTNEQPGSISYKLGLIAINPNEPKADDCEFGASGSVAQLADGHITGPLSMRNNTGYNGYYMSPDTATSGEYYRLLYEQETGLNLDKYSTICGFAIPVIPELTSDLAKVLAHPDIIVYQGGK